MHVKSQAASTIKQFFRAMDTQDLELMKDLLPKENEMTHIGTDKEEIWKGWEILMEATREQFKDLEHYKANIHDLTINISKSGDTAWYFHFLDAEIKSGGNTTNWNNARFTGVLEKRGGQWKLMQTHVSIPDSKISCYFDIISMTKIYERIQQNLRSNLGRYGSQSAHEALGL